MARSIKDKLKELDMENRLLTENLVHSIWMVDANTLKFEYISPNVSSLGGYTANELIGQSVFVELAPESTKKAVHLLKDELNVYKQSEHTSKSLELEMFHKNGNRYWVEITAKFVEEPSGLIKIIGVTRDITARKTANLRLEEQNRKLAEVLAEKERLLREIKVLRALLPICSGCKRIRDDHNKWWPIDAYVREHTDTDFTHTLCPDCKDVFYPGLEKKML
jgi:PAS domain S-box-containing protein